MHKSQRWNREVFDIVDFNIKKMVSEINALDGLVFEGVWLDPTRIQDLSKSLKWEKTG